MQTTSELECQPNWAASRSKRAFARMTVVAAVAMLLQTAWGGLGVLGVPDSAYVSAGLNFRGGVLWISGVTQSGVPFWESAIYLDPYNVLMTTHQTFITTSPAVYLAVGTGNNYSNSLGTVVGVHDYVTYQGYVAGGSTPDMAIAHLSAPLPSPTGPGINGNGGPVSLSPMTFASVSQGQTIWGAGFGVYGTFTGGAHARDGNSRAWNAPVDLNSHGFNANYYFAAEFSESGGFGQMNGLAAQGDSGGPWYDQSGNLVGISVAANTGTAGYTLIQWLADPTIQSWIRTNLFVPPTLLMQRAGTNAVLTWSGTFTLQTATNLTAGFTDVPGAASPYTNSITADPQRFFRLRLQ